MIAQFNKHEWSDVQPILQYDGNPPIMAIKYDEEYQGIMDIFRAIVKSEEVSERVFNLTTVVIGFLPSNYNGFYVRRRCLKQLNKSLQDELIYLNELTKGNEKVYQIWEHRRQLIEQLNEYDGEIEFLHKVLDLDNKNYHAWSYRIWLCQKFDLYLKGELQDIEYYIQEDIGNNSAWNYRYFLHFKIGVDLPAELNYVYSAIKQKPTNEATWNYLKGWFKLHEFTDSQPIGPRNFAEFNPLDYGVAEFVNSIILEQPDNRYALSLMVQLHLLNNELEKAIELCEQLALKYDTIRVVYWNWLIDNIKQQSKKE